MSYDHLQQSVLEEFAEFADQGVVQFLFRPESPSGRVFGRARPRSKKTPEQIRAKQAEWYAANATREREKRRRWGALNREIVRERNKKYRQKVKADPQRAALERERLRIKSARQRKQWAESADYQRTKAAKNARRRERRRQARELAAHPAQPEALP